MIKEYKCQGTMKTVVILLSTVAFISWFVILMGDDFLGYYLKSKYRKKDLEFFMYCFLDFALTIGYVQIMLHIQTKIQVFKQGVRLVGLRGNYFSLRKEKIKAKYSEVRSVATTGWYVNIDIQGNEYKIWCGSSREAEECCETIRKLMKQV